MLRALLFSATLATGCMAMVGTALAADGDAATRQGADRWRASKLVGVAIYGPNKENLGKVSDVLMTRDGRATTIVVEVGGFLGIGAKEVAVPYDQVTFTDQPMAPPANPNPAAMPMPPTAAAGAGTPPATAMNAAPPPRSTAYPDHGTIDMTVDQLKTAPTFSFAS